MTFLEIRFTLNHFAKKETQFPRIGLEFGSDLATVNVFEV